MEEWGFWEISKEGYGGCSQGELPSGSLWSTFCRHAIQFQGTLSLLDRQIKEEMV